MGAGGSTLSIKGDLVIQITNNILNAGDSLEGNIKLNVSQDCPPANLTLTIIGIEIGFHKEQSQKNANCTGNKKKFSEKIIDQTFLLKQYNEKLSKGSHISKFKIDLPSWLPPSLLLAPLPNSEFKVEYRLSALLTAQKSQQGSKQMYDERMFFVQRPMNEVPQENLQINFINKVGGFLGIGETKCEASIVFNKNHFYPGDVVVVDLDVDNSKCGASVEFYQVTLQQTIKTRSNNQFNSFFKEVNIVSMKVMAKLPAKASEKRQIEVEIPKKVQNSHYGPLQTDSQKTLKSLAFEVPPSFEGKYISISYVIKLAIRHSSWNQDKQGKIVELPVRISQSPASFYAPLAQQQPAQVTNPYHVQINTDSVKEILGQHQQQQISNPVWPKEIIHSQPKPNMYPTIPVVLPPGMPFNVPVVHPPSNGGMVLAVPVDDEYSSTNGYDQPVLMFNVNEDSSNQQYASSANNLNQQNYQPKIADEEIQIHYPEL